MSSSVACIDYRNGKILIAKRLNSGEMGGRWEFPGGKIESGESFSQAICREIKEEFGCKVQVFEQLAEGTFIHSGKECSVTAFRVSFDNDGITAPYELTEHTETKWVNPSEINSINFVDSDLGLFPQIKKSLGIEI